MYDVVIIGAGPAGLTAGIYAKRRSLKTLILSTDHGGQMAKIAEIENWPGEKKIHGFELTNRMVEQLKNLEVEMKFEKVDSVSKKDKTFEVKTSKTTYQSKTVIFAFGKIPREINVPGEKEFSGRGISYCVNCDAPFFKDKAVAVVGGGNSALDAAILLTKIAKKIYLIHRKDNFRAEQFMIDKIKNAKNVETIMNASISKIEGKDKVEKITLTNGSELAVDGVFVEIGYVVNDQLLKDFVELDEKGQVKVDENYMSSVQGVFAAGDVTNSPYKQLIIAAGEGATSALSAYQYIEKSF